MKVVKPRTEYYNVFDRMFDRKYTLISTTVLCRECWQIAYSFNFLQAWMCCNFAPFGPFSTQVSIFLYLKRMRRWKVSHVRTLRASGVCIFVRENFVIWSRNRPKSDILKGGGKQCFFSSLRRDTFTVVGNNWLPPSFCSLSSAVTVRQFETGSVLVEEQLYNSTVARNQQTEIWCLEKELNLNCI
jgi:hypothetical protein